MSSSSTGNPVGFRRHAPSEPANHAQGDIRPLFPVLVLVSVVALVVEVFMLSSSRLWPTGDSGGYLKLATAIAERFDFTHEYFQFRPPGYPILLAAIFRLCGDVSPQAILVLQHAMMLGITIFCVLIAWALNPHRGFALLAGLFAAFSIHLSSYANILMTEVPYAFALTLCVLLLVRYHVTGGWHWLIGASVAAGLCAVIKGMGQVMPVVCVGLALHRLWSMRRRSVPESHRGWARSVGLSVLAGAGPAALLILPVMINNYRNCGYFQLTCQGKLVLYVRACEVMGLDSSKSVAMAQVRETLAEAKRRKLVSDRVGLGYTFTIKDAFRFVHGASMAEAADVMGQAGLDIILEHPKEVFVAGLRDAYWTLFIPDPYYRVVPGERPPGMFDVSEIIAELALGFTPATMEKYLPLHHRPTFASPVRGKIGRWYRQHIAKGTPVLGLADTPYEELVLVCVFGGLLSLAQPCRIVWLMLGFVVFCHVVVSSFLGGPYPRYAVPVHPLMHIFGALAVLRLWQGAVVLSVAVGSRRASPAEHKPDNTAPASTQDC